MVERFLVLGFSVAMKLTTKYAAAVSLLCFVSLAELEAAEIHSVDFNADDGGYVASTFNPLGANASGPWTYGATGVGGSNAWSTTGGEGGDAGPFEQLLASPQISVPTTAQYTLEFDHSYNFEGQWDGGVVMVSVNGAPFAQATTFLQNGYNDVMQPDADWGYEGDMNGLPMFSINSGDFIHSVADLGMLTAGDTLDIQFRAGWDWFFVQPPVGEPQWTIDNVSVIPEPSTVVMLLAAGLAGLIAFIRRRK